MEVFKSRRNPLTEKEPNKLLRRRQINGENDNANIATSTPTLPSSTPVGEDDAIQANQTPKVSTVPDESKTRQLTEWKSFNSLTTDDLKSRPASQLQTLRPEERIRFLRRSKKGPFGRVDSITILSDFHVKCEFFQGRVRKLQITSPLFSFQHIADETRQSVIAFKEHCEHNIASHMCQLASSNNSRQLERALQGMENIVNVGDYDKRVPLHLAAAKGNLDVVKLLIKYKANMSCEDHIGRTPLLEAVENGRDGVLKVLLSHGAQLRLKNRGEYLCNVTHQGDVAKLRRLLSARASPNVRDYDYRTGLHIAAADGNLQMCKLLLEHKASADVKDRWGSTPLHSAKKSKQDEIVHALKKSKSKSHSRSNSLPSASLVRRRGRSRECRETVINQHETGRVIDPAPLPVTISHKNESISGNKTNSLSDDTTLESESPVLGPSS